jgi:hypothetical protein
MVCPYMDQCQSPKEQGTGPVYRRRFCLEDCTRCARFQLAGHWPMEAIPDWIRPTMMAHAELLLRHREQGLADLPASMPTAI